MPGLTKKTLARSESKQSQYDLGKHPANPVKLGRLTQQIASTRTQKKNQRETEKLIGGRV